MWIYLFLLGIIRIDNAKIEEYANDSFYSRSAPPAYDRSRRDETLRRLIDTAAPHQAQRQLYHQRPACSTRDFVREGDVVSIVIPVKNEFAPEDIPIGIVYEDDYLMVIDKPAGILMHPTSAVRDGTLANAVAYHYEKTGQHCSYHPMHRLDKNTSGLCMVAKEPQIQYAFDKKDLSYKRLYLAICQGRYLRGSQLYTPPSEDVPTASLPAASGPMESRLIPILPAWPGMTNTVCSKSYCIPDGLIRSGSTAVISAIPSSGMIYTAVRAASCSARRFTPTACSLPTP